MSMEGFDDDRRMFSLEQPTLSRMSSTVFEGEQRQQLIALLQQALTTLQDGQQTAITPAAPRKCARCVCGNVSVIPLFRTGLLSQSPLYFV
jgi:hypothetical protein